MSTAPSFTPTEPHPVLQLPTREEALRMGPENWMVAMEKREAAIRYEQTEPLYRCWEPPIWRICDALWGAPWLPAAEAEAIRLNLGFTKPVSVLYLLGAQRSSKTEYAVNRLSRMMQLRSDGLTWMFHNTMPASVDGHQPLFWKYLPPNLRGKPIMSQTTYVAYKEKTGFSEGSFVLPNLHKCRFLSHDMDLMNLQGLNLDMAGTDENTPPETVETLKARVSVKNGAVFVMLAPILGYTPLVQSATDGAEDVRECIAYMNPADGGPRDYARYLGLTAEELVTLRACVDRRMLPPFPNVPWARPEECRKWLTGEPSQPAPAPGRKFKMIPRIQRPADPEGKSVIVHFHGNDNPFGNPLNLALLNATASEEQGNRIFYGVAREGAAVQFPLFGKAHILPDEAIPTAGTNYVWVDPAGRNFFKTWLRFGPRNRVYLYREWPGNYDIPGHGVPGPWAIPDGKLKDGRRGPAQDSFGFGLIDYKREFARLEGWKDAAKDWDDKQSDEEQIKQWFPENGAREYVTDRFMDSRYASTPHLENDRPVTLLESFAEIGLFFHPTSGASVNEGIKLINDALRWDTTKPISALNCPRFYVAASCLNSIFALRTWRNADGSKSATGDPIACLRYAFTQGVGYLTPEDYATRGGGHY